MKASYPHTAMGSPGHCTPVSYSPKGLTTSGTLQVFLFILLYRLTNPNVNILTANYTAAIPVEIAK
jgi:hypothetical protein